MNVVSITKKILDSKDYLELLKKLEDVSSKDLINYLFNYLAIFLRSSDISPETMSEVFDKCMFFVDCVVKEEAIDHILIIKKIVNLKTFCINCVKKVEKSKRKNNKSVNTMRAIINDLEKYEIMLRYNISADLKDSNNNIIKYILFDMKNLKLSESLITNYPYLINICRYNNDDALSMAVTNYINSLVEYDKDFTKRFPLIYYNRIIDLLLRDDKIDSSKYLKNCFARIVNILNSNYLKDENVVWLNYLIKRLEVKKYVPDVKTLASIYNLKFNFLRRTCDEVNNMQVCQTSNNEKYIISIDDAFVLGRDDAFTATKLKNGNYLLDVYITDVNYFLNNFSLLREEARKRVQNLYFDDDVIPLFPIQFVLNLSLDEGKNRRVRNYSMELDKYGNLISFKVCKDIIRVSKNFSFDQATNLIKHNSNCKDIEEVISTLLTVVSLINKNGYFAEMKSQKVVESIMMYLSSVDANYFFSKDLPFIYRTNCVSMELPGYIKSILEHCDNDGYNSIINETFNHHTKTEYSVFPEKHEQLRLDSYANPNSPLRMYASILVNECHDLFYFHDASDKELTKHEKYLDDEVKYLNARTKELSCFMKDYSYLKGNNRVRKN